MAETLPGLLLAQYQRVRWHLLNVGSDTEIHAVHFHGLPFTIHAKQEHRMGVYNLFPGKYICIFIYLVLLHSPRLYCSSSYDDTWTWTDASTEITDLFLPPLGVFGTVEMRPPTVGTWLVECTIGDYQLAGMRAKLLVYDPSTCNVLWPSNAAVNSIDWAFRWRMAPAEHAKNCIAYGSFLCACGNL